MANVSELSYVHLYFMNYFCESLLEKMHANYIKYGNIFVVYKCVCV